MKRLAAVCFGVAAITAAGLAAVMLYYSVPGESLWLPQCRFYVCTGLYCPGCGSTRALHYLLHGDIAWALRSNILILTLAPLVMLLALSDLLNRWTRGRCRCINVPNWAAYLVLALLVAFWGLRNIPIYPFTMLAPP